MKFTSPRSMRGTILFWVLTPLLLAFSASVAATNFVLQDNLAREIDESLIHEADELSILAEMALDPNTGLPYDSAEKVLNLYVQRSVIDKNESIFVVVNGIVSERNADNALGRLDKDKNFIKRVVTTQSPQLEDYSSEIGEIRYIAVPVSGKFDSGFLVAAISVSAETETLGQTISQLSLFTLLAFVLAAFAAWFVSGRILKPIRDLQAMTRTIRDENLVERLEVSNPKSEIGGIANDFNDMLDRISESFDAQKKFIDDAGHELKTPLTIISGHLDLVKGDSKESDSSLEIVRDEVSRMSRIVKDLQMLTNSSGPKFLTLTEILPTDLIDEVFVKSAALASRNWLIKGTSKGKWSLDHKRIVQALLQLIDNAIKHTTEKDSIEIGFAQSDKEITFFVGDSGPGILDSEKELVKQRFVRGSWTSQDTEGSGLGLAIVDAVAKAHRGKLQIHKSHLGGAEVRITIPNLHEDSNKN